MSAWQKYNVYIFIHTNFARFSFFQQPVLLHQALGFCRKNSQKLSVHNKNIAYYKDKLVNIKT